MVDKTKTHILGSVGLFLYVIMWKNTMYSARPQMTVWCNAHCKLGT